MTFEEALRLRIINDPAVAMMQGSRASWGTRPQGGVLPCTVMNIVYDPFPTEFEGTSETRETIVQIDVWGDLPGVVSLLSSALIDALLRPAAVGGFQFRRAFVSANRDAGEQAGNAFLARRIIEMSFWHSII